MTVLVLFEDEGSKDGRLSAPIVVAIKLFVQTNTPPSDQSDNAGINECWYWWNKFFVSLMFLRRVCSVYSVCFYYDRVDSSGSLSFRFRTTATPWSSLEIPTPSSAPRRTPNVCAWASPSFTARRSRNPKKTTAEIRLRSLIWTPNVWSPWAWKCSPVGVRPEIYVEFGQCSVQFLSCIEKRSRFRRPSVRRETFWIPFEFSCC